MNRARSLEQNSPFSGLAYSYLASPSPREPLASSSCPSAPAAAPDPSAVASAERGGQTRCPSRPASPPGTWAAAVDRLGTDSGASALTVRFCRPRSNSTPPLWKREHSLSGAFSDGVGAKGQREGVVGRSDGRHNRTCEWPTGEKKGSEKTGLGRKASISCGEIENKNTALSAFGSSLSKNADCETINTFTMIVITHSAQEYDGRIAFIDKMVPKDGSRMI